MSKNAFLGLLRIGDKISVLECRFASQYMYVPIIHTFSKKAECRICFVNQSIHDDLPFIPINLMSGDFEVIENNEGELKFKQMT